jgi:tetratricopeptide (TPR) repeat protein
VKKQQMILIGGGALLFCLIYFFGRTIPLKTNSALATVEPAAKGIDINTILAASRQQLNSTQQSRLSQLEASVVRGDVKEQQIKVYKELAAFWRDSVHMALPYAWYIGESAKLENSQKNLTFAAQFFLEGLRHQDDPELKRWMGFEAKELFEKALQLAPDNDSLKIGLGSCYIFGNISDMPMQGIQLIREVGDKEPENMYAQFMLGLGDAQSGQLDKAVERLTKVVQHEPNNLEALFTLADVYERKGDKGNAIKMYETVRKKVHDPEVLKEIDNRINVLKK